MMDKVHPDYAPPPPDRVWAAARTVARHADGDLELTRELLDELGLLPLLHTTPRPRAS